MSIDEATLTKQIEDAASFENDNLQADAEKFDYTVELAVSFGKAVTIGEVVQALNSGNFSYSESFRVTDAGVQIEFKHIHLKKAYALAKILEDKQIDADLEVTALKPYSDHRIDIDPVSLYSKKGPK